MISLQKHTTYHELCNDVFSKIKDYGLAGLDQCVAFDIIQEYIAPAILMFSGCSQDLNDRNDQIGEFNFALSSRNFQILSNYMVVCYLDSNYIRTGEMLKSHLSSTDFHKYDNKDTLGKVKEVREMYKAENDQLMVNYSYHESPLFDAVQQRGH